MEYQKTELEMLKQEEAICELSGVKNDEIDRFLAYMDGQEQIID